MRGKLTMGVAASAALAGLLALSGATTAEEAAPEQARVGQKAPDFELKCTAGKTHKLSDYVAEGKVVVLEWFNPDCPAVVLHHRSNKTMRDAAKAYADKGVVWLAVNSGAEGKQGAGLERNKRAISEYDMPYPVLLDESGKVGRAYAARVTPQMVVVDAKGDVAYAGAIDDGSSRRAGEVNHVTNALDAILAGEAPKTAETRPYG